MKLKILVLIGIALFCFTSFTFAQDTNETTTPITPLTTTPYTPTTYQTTTQIDLMTIALIGAIAFFAIIAFYHFIYTKSKHPFKLKSNAPLLEDISQVMYLGDGGSGYNAFVRTVDKINGLLKIELKDGTVLSGVRPHHYANPEILPIIDDVETTAGKKILWICKVGRDQSRQGWAFPHIESYASQVSRIRESLKYSVEQDLLKQASLRDFLKSDSEASAEQLRKSIENQYGVEKSGKVEE